MTIFQMLLNYVAVKHAMCENCGCDYDADVRKQKTLVSNKFNHGRFQG